MKVVGLKTRKIFCLLLGFSHFNEAFSMRKKKKRKKYFRKAPPPTGSKQKHALYFSSTIIIREKNRLTIRDYKLLSFIY